MNDQAAGLAEPLRALLGEVVERTVRQYRVSPEAAERIIRRSWEADPQLLAAARQTISTERLRRMRVFKEAVRAAKRAVYYQLRNYVVADEGQADPLAAYRDLAESYPAADGDVQRLRGEVLARHASTRERLPVAGEFYRQLFARLSPPTTLLDVGCGVQPLMFPWEDVWGAGLQRYVALDSMRPEVACVEADARWRGDRRVLAQVWNLAEGWEPVLQLAGVNQFDVALLMKLVPVVHRQQRELLDILAATPARAWLLTGSRLSLTRQASIERREKRVLGDFVRRAGRQVDSEFSVGEEFAWIVR